MATHPYQWYDCKSIDVVSIKTILQAHSQRLFIIRRKVLLQALKACFRGDALARIQV
jgi:hypothetical protein